MSFLARLFGRRPEPLPLTLYTRPDCPLCDEMKRELQDLDLGRPFSLEVVDIAGDARLTELYGKRIPVLVAAGKLIAEGRMDVLAVRRAFDRRAVEWERSRELARALERRSERR
jgi:hypothetical protein